MMCIHIEPDPDDAQFVRAMQLQRRRISEEQMRNGFLVISEARR